MKKLFIFTAISLHIAGMETSAKQHKLLTATPFEGERVKLISFAESMVLGKLMIGKQISAGNSSICFMFNNFRNPEISYTATQQEVWDATRYIVALKLKELIARENKNLTSVAIGDLYDRWQMTKHILERISKHTTQLLGLNVSESISMMPASTKETELQAKLKEFEKTLTGSKEENEQKKTELRVAILKEYRQDLTYLREIAFTRFYGFWDQTDLMKQTKNDRDRDFNAVKLKRNAFFEALQNNDIDELCQFSETMKSIVAKEKPTTLGVIDKAIGLLQRHRHLNPRSADNSDDEIL